MKLNIHHIGTVVESIDASLKEYGQLGFQDHSAIYDISSQNVKVCFLEIGNGTLMEFVEPYEDNKPLLKLIKKNTPYYHIGYLSSDFDNDIADLEGKNYKLLNIFHSEAFQNNRCAFLYSPELHLIELIENK